MRTLWFTFVVFVLSGCGRFVYGGGEIFVWNGTGARYEITLEGRTNATLTLGPKSGARLAGVAGKSTLVAQKSQGGARKYELMLERDRALLVNLDADACFARADIAGMYQPGKERLKVIKVYGQAEVIALDAAAAVWPGEAPPATRPKSVGTFQRIYEVPCELLAKDNELKDFLRAVR